MSLSPSKQRERERGLEQWKWQKNQSALITIKETTPQRKQLLGSDSAIWKRANPGPVIIQTELLCSSSSSRWLPFTVLFTRSFLFGSSVSIRNRSNCNSWIRKVKILQNQQLKTFYKKSQSAAIIFQSSITDKQIAPKIGSTTKWNPITVFVKEKREWAGFGFCSPWT